MIKNHMPIPEPHRSFLEKMLNKLQTDERLLGVAIAGSYLSGEMDEYSDLDLIIVIDDVYYHNILQEREIFASQFSSLLAAFTGEHVGEPRLLICLYDHPLLHVDFKFLRLQEFFTDRVENPAVLWEKENLLTLAVANHPCHYPPVDLQWIEDRFWVWIHYCAAKLGRGELFEALDFLAFLRGQVLAPLAKVEAGRLPRGVRNLEKEIPLRLRDFCQTIAAKHDRYEIAQALQNTIHFYRQLRDALNLPDLIVRANAEFASTQYLQKIIDNFDSVN
ncbi:oxalate:formate antiporter [Nostoc sp. CENA543]|uniref:nucleotidyltransferase domain-containing protein n=1 Tax=Nostoc sp. CENA543 TaxID=1869241 RepID=UPI000CA0E618|nr:nucleotidyltransferase domain-containing protein [Nostoc sp. CENA543]AUT03307.1 oxalate:formate antiporter [Nostoc sp. CENA543]